MNMKRKRSNSSGSDTNYTEDVHFSEEIISEFDIQDNTYVHDNMDSIVVIENDENYTDPLQNVKIKKDPSLVTVIEHLISSEDEEETESSKIEILDSTADIEVYSPSNDEYNLSEDAQKYTIFRSGCFSIVNVDKNNPKKLYAKCRYCNEIRCGQRGSTSNFYRHLKLKHEDHIGDYLGQKKLTFAQTNFISSQAVSAKKVTSKQTTSSMVETSEMQSLATVKQFNDSILHFIIDGLHSLDIINEPSFVNMFPGRLIELRSTFLRRISKMRENMQRSLINRLEEKQICLTTNICFITSDEYYFAVTAHFFNHNLDRESYALTCQHLRRSEKVDLNDGQNLWSIIEIKLQEVCNEYNLQREQIIMNVIGGISNQIELLHKMGVGMSSIDLSDTYSCQIDATFANFSNYYANENDMANTICKHIRCITYHLVSLISVDFQNILKNAEDSYLHEICVQRENFMIKANVIWTALHNEDTSEFTKCVVGRTIVCPQSIRSTSLYNAIKKLKIVGIEKLNAALKSLFDATGDEKMAEAEFNQFDQDYMELYLRVMQPMIIAIEKCQSPQANYGYFLPTIHTLYLKWLKMANDVEENVECDGALIRAMISMLEQRFGKYLDLNTDDDDVKFALIATMTHPKFKLNWMFKRMLEDYADVKLRLIKVFNEVMKVELVNQDNVVENQSIKYIADSISVLNDDKEDEWFELFFDLDEEKKLKCSHNVIENEVATYFNQAYLTDLSSLNPFPNIKRMFKKYNTVLPSSIPIEDLLNFDLIVRNRLNYSNCSLYEDCILLKANRKQLNCKSL